MTRTPLPILIAATLISCIAAAEETKLPPGERRPYGDHVYRYDRAHTGRYFRSLREFRETHGNEAALRRLDKEWIAYREKRRADGARDEIIYDRWGFWVWHEAQYDTGADDPSWSLMLYDWIYRTSQSMGRLDWSMHVVTNLMSANKTAHHWGTVRQLGDTVEAYFLTQGFQLDPAALPDLAPWHPDVPFVRQRKFPVRVPNSRHVVSWQRLETTDVDQPLLLDNMLVFLIRNLIDRDQQSGDWIRAMERNIWLIEWTTAVFTHNENPDRPYDLRRHTADTYRGAHLSMAEILNSIGLRETAREILDRAFLRGDITKWFPDIIHALHLLDISMKLDAGEATPEEVLARLVEIDKLVTEAFGDQSDARNSSDLVRAGALVKMGKTDEAAALLREICQRATVRFGNLDAELALLNLRIDTGDHDGIRDTLHALLAHVRSQGLKVDELSIYRCYVHWAMTTGAYQEALLAQREVLRLLQSFSMTPLIPVEQARLAVILDALGNSADADKIIAQLPARDERLWRHREIDRILKTRTPSPTTAPADPAPSHVRMMPVQVISMALDGFDARAVISLVNDGATRAEGTLRASNLPAAISWDLASRRGTLRAHPDALVHAVSGPVVLEAGEMGVLDCFASATKQSEQTILIEWLENDIVHGSSTWTLQAADAASDIAVIDAGAYLNNRFRMIPIFHHLQSRTADPANIRVLTSQPCRVELYDRNGTLQIIDSSGNGSLNDSGDWLGNDRNRDGFADLLPAPDSLETNFHLQIDAGDWSGSEPISVRVEILHEGAWFLAAENRIDNPSGD